MSECRHFRGLLDAFAAGELGEGDEAAVAEHIVGCAECAGAVADYRKIREAIRTAAGDAPVADRRFFNGLSRRLDEATPSAAPEGMKWHLVAGVAAAAAVVLMISAQLLPGKPGEGARDGQPLAAAPETADVYMRGTSPYDFADVSKRSRLPYVSVSSNPGTVGYGGNMGNVPSALPRFDFPRQTWPTANATGLESGFVTLADYNRLQDKVRQLEWKLERLEKASAPAE